MNGQVMYIFDDDISVFSEYSYVMDYCDIFVDVGIGRMIKFGNIFVCDYFDGILNRMYYKNLPYSIAFIECM
jgi:hypothetical protein